MRKKLIYWEGVVDVIIANLFQEVIHIEDEKLFTYKIQSHLNGWKVNMKWCTYYESSKFQGDYLQPTDGDMPNMESQELYFAFDATITDVIKEITEQLEIIQNSKFPELI